MRLFHFRDWPLRLKILVVLLVAALAPMAIALAIGFRIVEKESRRQMETLLTARVDVLAGHLNEFLHQCERAAWFTARRPELVAYARTPQEARKAGARTVRDYFTQRLGQDPNLFAYAVVDRQGRVVVASPPALEGRDWSALPYLRSLWHKPPTAPPTASDVRFLSLAGDAREVPVFAFAEPVHDRHAPSKELAVAVVYRAQSLWDIIDNYRKKVEDASFISLVDPHGVRIAHTDPKMLFRPVAPLSADELAAMERQSRFGGHTAEYLSDVHPFTAQHELVRKGHDGTVLLEGYAERNDQVNVGAARRLRTEPWTLFFMLPAPNLRDPVYGMFKQVVLWCAPVVVLGLLVGILLAGRVLRPLGFLSQASRRLGGGDLSARVPAGSKDELGELATRFNAMAAQLQASVHAVNEREAHIRAIMDTTADGIITIDEGAKIESLNAAALRLFGYGEREAAGRNLGVLLAEGRAWSLADIERHLGATDSVVLGFRAELEARRKDGTVFPVELALAEINGSGVRRFTATFHDLTRRKQAEDELRRAKEAAEEANRAKSQFLANMSHELRTPLNVIINYAEMLQEECEEQEQKGFIPDLQRIHASGKHQLSLINDILDMSKIEAGRIDLCPETFDVGRMVQDVVTTIRPVVEKNSNALVLDCPDGLGQMHSDLTRVRQVLFNLLSNAGKFTEKGSVTLSVRRGQRDGRDWLTFAVRDTGIGLTPEQRSRLFQAFVQADASTTRKFGGTGLGLAISLRLSEMMGGTIEVESEPDKGSTFTLSLPAASRERERPESPLPPGADAPGSPKAVAHAPGSPPMARGATVLVVDDDPAVRDILQRYLTAEGFRVVAVERGEDALRAAREARPAAITLDVMMPGQDGWSVLSALKNDPELADIPVVMLSIVDDKNLGFALGASEYLTKPVDRDRLLSVLKRYCSAPRTGVALVVEDDVPTRDLLRRMLEKDGWEVREAGNGRAALECVAAQPPALILLDLMMPEMDGFEFLEELRQHADWKDIPVVVITAKDLTEEDRLFLNTAPMLSNCVKRVLQKGKFSRDELLSEVRNLVAGRP